tara:strand:- start:75 stop:323 length:249 start_codon:yes stop_codon:yes gene_type:complete
MLKKPNEKELEKLREKCLVESKLDEEKLKDELGPKMCDFLGRITDICEYLERSGFFPEFDETGEVFKIALKVYELERKYNQF